MFLMGLDTPWKSYKSLWGSLLLFQMGPLLSWMGEHPTAAGPRLLIEINTTEALLGDAS